MRAWARAQRSSEAGYFAVVNTMLTSLAPASTRSALEIRESYRPFFDLLALDDFNQIEQGLANGGLVPLPNDPEAFDIAMVNTPLKTVREIIHVLQQMSAAGDILVIAERHQLVFHVVPQPSRLGWYTEVYTHLIAGQPWTRPADASASMTPAVDAVISSLQPMPAFAAEWWAADNVPLDMPISVRVEPDHPAGSDVGARGLAGYFGLVGELLSSTWRLMSPWTVG